MTSRLRPLAVLLLLLLATTMSCSRGDRAAPAAEPGAATVIRVVDGDTIRARIGGRNERVRLIGIDTPESVTPNSPVECFGREASSRMKELLPEGSAVKLVRDVEARDRFDRLLAYVYRQRDGLFVNLALVQDGYALPATFPPNVAHTDEFLAAAAEARVARRGLWSSCVGDTVAP